MKRIVLLTSLVAAFVICCLTACSDSPTPVSTPDIELIFELIQETTNGETHTAVLSQAHNDGDVAVHHAINCGYDVWISVENEAGEFLKMRDPTLSPVCPPGFIDLVPGETIGHSHRLDRAWNDDGSTYLIPEGRYTVRTSFTYYVGTEDTPIRLDGEIVIDIVE